MATLQEFNRAMEGIASCIRSKDGTTALIFPREMADKIRTMPHLKISSLDDYISSPSYRFDSSIVITNAKKIAYNLLGEHTRGIFIALEATEISVFIPSDIKSFYAPKLNNFIDTGSIDTDKVIVNNIQKTGYCPFSTKYLTLLSPTFTPITSSVGCNLYYLKKIYVPDNLVDTYKQATNWCLYADYIQGISQSPTKIWEVNK